MAILKGAEALAIKALNASNKAYIVLQSTSTQVISEDSLNPTVLDGWVVLASNGISLQGDSIRNDTGRVIPAMGGTIGIHPVIDGGGGSRLLSFTSEASFDDGLTYSLNNQIRYIYTSNNEQNYNTKESYVTGFNAGTQARFIMYSSGPLSVGPSSSLFRGETVTGPAALWVLAEL